jgi:hypothetical protein
MPVLETSEIKATSLFSSYVFSREELDPQTNQLLSDSHI